MKALHGILIALDLLVGAKDVVDVCCAASPRCGIVATIDSDVASAESNGSSTTSVAPDAGSK